VAWGIVRCKIVGEMNAVKIPAESVTMTATMRAFEVYLNGKRLCVAGIGDNGVLTTIIDHVSGHGRNEQHVRIGGLVNATDEHVHWGLKRLKTGDEVLVKIVESISVDRPTKRRKRDPKEELKREKQYVKDMARKLGWKLTTGR
jgi:hypothetical protein